MFNWSRWLCILQFFKLDGRQWLCVLQAYAYALMYEPQPIAASIVQYKPLAPLAAKAEAWEMSFVVRHTSGTSLCTC